MSIGTSSKYHLQAEAKISQMPAEGGTPNMPPEEFLTVEED
jgi:hypothetical protein